MTRRSPAELCTCSDPRHINRPSPPPPRQATNAGLAQMDSVQAAYAGLLPPPLWGRAGEGGAGFANEVRLSHDPHPQPLPTRGRGADRVRGAAVGLIQRNAL